MNHFCLLEKGIKCLFFGGVSSVFGNFGLQKTELCKQLFSEVSEGAYLFVNK